MKVVITGFDARSSRAVTGEKNLSFGYLINETLALQGVEVHQHECWPEDRVCKQHLADADLVFVGISSPLALTSHYALSSMAVLHSMLGDSRLRIFVDDPNTAKIGHGSASAFRRWKEDASKDPLFTNLALSRRPHFDDALKKREMFYEVCDHLTRWWELGPTYVPVSNTFGDYGLSAKNRGLIPLDLTHTALNHLDGYFEGRAPRKSLPKKLQSWYIEPVVVGGSRWAFGVYTRRDSVSFQVKGWKKKIETLVAHYGVIESPKSKDIVGWWSSTPVLAAVSRQFYASAVSDVKAYEEPESAYRTLPNVYETLDVATQQAVIDRQKEELMGSSPSIELASAVLTDQKQDS